MLKTLIPPHSKQSRGGRFVEVFPVLWAATSISSLWSYILCVVALDQTMAGFTVSTSHIAFATMAGFVLSSTFFIVVIKRGVFSASAMRDISLAISTTVFGLVSLDVGYSVFLNLSQPRLTADDRLSDANTWIGELYPELYFPTKQNFRLQKPAWSVTGSHFGDMYRPTLIASPLLASSVFSKKHVAISINNDGFREAAQGKGEKIVAIGDSFTFGWGITQDRTWVELLERSLGQSIYNMGMHDSSPKQEFLLLQHMIDSRKVDLKGGVLLWVFFEGNDLEDSYDDEHPILNPGLTLGRLFQGTIVETVWKLPSIIQQESVLKRFQSGRAELASLGRGDHPKKHYVIDGIVSPFPIYTSSHFGAKLFIPKYILGAQRSEQYIESHPNRVPIEKTFGRMKSLANREGFQVLVIIAPSDVRLYGKEFEDFPILSEKSYFNVLVSRLGKQHGFEVVNLEELLTPYATRELLYFRDDDHWNERGHAVVADVLRTVLLSRPTTAAAPEK